MEEYRTVKKIPADKVTVIKKCSRCGIEEREILDEMISCVGEICTDCNKTENIMEIIEIEIEEYFHF